MEVSKWLFLTLYRWQTRQQVICARRQVGWKNRSKRIVCVCFSSILSWRIMKGAASEQIEVPLGLSGLVLLF